MPPFWMIYFAVDDADKAAADIAAAGGRVHREPADIPGTGRFAVVGDPQGAGFGILQPEPMPDGGAGNAFDQQKAGPRQLERADDDRPRGGLPLLRRPLRLAEVAGRRHGRDGHLPALLPRRHRHRRHDGPRQLAGPGLAALLRHQRRRRGDRADRDGRRQAGPRTRWRFPAAPSSPSPRTRRAPSSPWSGRKRSAEARAQRTVVQTPTISGPRAKCRFAASSAAISCLQAGDLGGLGDAERLGGWDEARQHRADHRSRGG